MSDADHLVSICLPVRNGADSIASVVRSVLAQDHPNLSWSSAITRPPTTPSPRAGNWPIRTTESCTTATCRTSASSRTSSSPCRAPRDPSSDGSVTRLAEPRLCLPLPSGAIQPPRGHPGDDANRVRGPDGAVSASTAYTGVELASSDPMIRYDAILEVLNASTFVVDPLYALLRRERIVADPSPKHVSRGSAICGEARAEGAVGSRAPRPRRPQHHERPRFGDGATPRRSGLAACGPARLCCAETSSATSSPDLSPQSRGDTHTPHFGASTYGAKLIIARHRYRRVRRVAGSAYAASRALVASSERSAGIGS